MEKVGCWQIVVIKGPKPTLVRTDIPTQMEAVDICQLLIEAYCDGIDQGKLDQMALQAEVELHRCKVCHLVVQDRDAKLVDFGFQEDDGFFIHEHCWAKRELIILTQNP